MSKFNIPSSEHPSLNSGLRFGGSKLVDAFLVYDLDVYEGSPDNMPSLEYVKTAINTVYYIQPCKVDLCQVVGRCLFDGAYIDGRFVTAEELVKDMSCWIRPVRINRIYTKNPRIYLSRESAIHDIELLCEEEIINNRILGY